MVSGTAAKGLAIASTTVTIRDKSGNTKTGTTNSNGSYTVDTTGMTLPFLLQISSGTGYFYSVATATGTTNIHPFTDLIIRNWYAVKGLDVNTVFAGPAPLVMPSMSEINTIEAVFRNILSTWLANTGLTASTFNLLTSPFNANGTGFDLVLDNTAVVIDTTTGNVTVTTTNPNTGFVSTMMTTSLTTTQTVADTTPPAVPTGLSAISASTTSVVLSWNASSDNVGVTGYNIYRDGSKIGSSPYPAYVDTGLSAGTLYAYTVKALDGAFNSSADSNVASATTLADVGLRQFDGTYTGIIMGKRAEFGIPFALTFTVTNGVFTVTQPSQAGDTGTVSAAGAITAGAINIGANGGCPGTDTFTGQITLTSTGVATATGSDFSSGTTGICSAATSTWTATRTTTTTSVSAYNGIYTGGAIGTLISGGQDSFVVGFTVIDGVVTTMDNTTGVVSSSGAITFTSGGCASGNNGTPVPYGAMTGQITLSATGEAMVTGTWSAPTLTGPTGSCDARSGTWAATTSKGTSLGRFDGIYSARLVGTQTTGSNAGANVSAPFAYTATNGVISGAGIGLGTIAGTASSFGTFTLIVPKNSSSIGAPCADITFNGVGVVTSSLGVAVIGTWSSPSGGPDPLGGVCPGFSGTWMAARP
jgi:hypothetical protein